MILAIQIGARGRTMRRSTGKGLEPGTWVGLAKVWVAPNRVDLHTSLAKLSTWIERNGLRGYDPYDALANPMIAWLDRRSSLAGRLAIQALRYLPFNVRPLLGIGPKVDAKALGLLARGYFLIWDRTQTAAAWEKGVGCLEVMEQLQVPGFSGACWAHPFPYRSRRGYLPANHPSIVSTFYATQAFLDAHERSGDAHYLHVARSACDFVVTDLERIGTDESFCFGYLPNARLAIHNANLLAVQLLSRVAKLNKEPSLLEIVPPALRYTLDDQNPDGSWYYDGPDSAARSQTFIDGFHTGFVLESLWDIASNAAMNLEDPLRRGLGFYLESLFSSDGQPFRMVNKPWPVDLRDCAQAIIVLAKLPNDLLPGEDILSRVVAWTIKNMQAPAGYFYFTRYGRWVTLVPYIRFQAWMLASLATAANS